MSKISSKGQTTIPQEVRDQLKAGPGDLLQYSWEDGKLVVRKFSVDEALYLKGLQTQLSEWEGSADDDLV